MKIKIPRELHERWHKRGKKLAEEDLLQRLRSGILTAEDLEAFDLKYLLSDEVQEQIFEPWIAFCEGQKANKKRTEAKNVLELSRKDRDYGRTFSEGKDIPELSVENVSKAALRTHARRKGDGNYWFQQARKAEEERARLNKEKARARALPSKVKKRILSAFQTDRFKRPLSYNKIAKQ